MAARGQIRFCGATLLLAVILKSPARGRKNLPDARNANLLWPITMKRKPDKAAGGYVHHGLEFFLAKAKPVTNQVRLAGRFFQALEGLPE